jgi:hypothetical protein
MQMLYYTVLHGMGFAKFCVTSNEMFKGQHENRNSRIKQDSGAPPLYGA